MKRNCQNWVAASVAACLIAGCQTVRHTLRQPPGKPAVSRVTLQPTEQAQSPAVLSQSSTAGAMAAGAQSPGQEHLSRLAPIPPASQCQLVSASIEVVTATDVDGPTPTVEVTPIAQAVPNPAEPAPDASSDTLNASLPINLPTALAMVGGQHPVVGFARWRVQEAYAQLDQTQALWLPSIQSGFNYRRRDGNYQAVGGEIVDVNLNSMNYGLGAGAVAAGSPTRPGVVAQFHLADALFLPKAAERTAWARGHAAAATLNSQLLRAGLSYLDLLEAYQEFGILQAALERTTELVALTKDFAEAGAGLQADADRAATELALLETRQLATRERQLVASSRLARDLGITMTSTLLPQDTVAVALEMLPVQNDEPTLIATALAARPELKESQALVAAACEAYRREKYSPFVPSVLLGFSTTSFGGGIGSSANDFAGRYDADAMMVWETRNLGLGEAAARRTRNAQVQQAIFTKLRLLDQVAQEVTEAHIQVTIRRQQMETSQRAIERARESFQRNVDRIREGQGLPIEVLQSIQALEAAERAYMRAVVDHNRAQLQLQWSLGWSIEAT